MAINIYDCSQGSDEWLRLRMGRATASEFHTVMASGRDGGDSKTRKTYLYKLAGEIITGQPMESYSNSDMLRGKEQEAEARDLYSFLTDNPVETVGFITNELAGSSPDGLIGTNGTIEIKSAAPHIQVERLLKNQLPPEHRAQCQGGLWVSAREWVDFISYCPNMPPLIVRARREESYIKGIEDAVRIFNAELQEIVARIRARSQEVAAA